MQKIMIIEDDPGIREEITFLLENEGYQPLPITDFQDVTGQVKEAQPDLVLLDLGLPGRDGFTLCAAIRKMSSLPIIVVTSRDTAMDELQALSMGSDDFIAKPYNVPVLLARIKAVLKRSGTAADVDTIETKGLTLDLMKGIISHDGQSAELTRNELRILSCLMGRPDEIVSRADLIESLWDSQIYIDDNTLSVNITRLRTKLNDLGLPDYIKTRRGMGYQI
ncbi:response regulator transcription factor [Anaerolentibacter hominis]|uniref:response regulator transcription factor n=1 Tax=Anaerolentibacter hominis TaxID=3079009 RepID=UPI0031B8968E